MLANESDLIGVYLHVLLHITYAAYYFSTHHAGSRIRFKMSLFVLFQSFFVNECFSTVVTLEDLMFYSLFFFTTGTTETALAWWSWRPWWDIVRKFSTIGTFLKRDHIAETLDIFSRYIQRQEYLSPHFDSKRIPEAYEILKYMIFFVVFLCCLRIYAAHTVKNITGCGFGFGFGAYLLHYKKQINV